MDTELQEFTLDMLKPRSMTFILGKSGSETIKDIIANNTETNCVVCTPKKGFYTQFICTSKIYKRYSPIITNRCFFDNTCLVLDQCVFHKEYIEEIYTNFQGKNMIIALSSESQFYDFARYDYIFINSVTSIPELFKVYQHSLSSFEKEITIEQFLKLVEKCEDVLVINTKALVFDELFMYYEITTHDDLDLRDR